MADFILFVYFPGKMGLPESCSYIHVSDLCFKEFVCPSGLMRVYLPKGLFVSLRRFNSIGTKREKDRNFAAWRFNLQLGNLFLNEGNAALGEINTEAVGPVSLELLKIQQDKATATSIIF